MGMGLLSLRLLAADHREECHAPLCSLEARNAQLRYVHGEVVSDPKMAWEGTIGLSLAAVSVRTSQP